MAEHLARGSQTRGTMDRTGRSVAKLIPVGRIGPQPASRTTSPGRTQPRPLERVRQALRAGHYIPRTESASVVWIRRFILFHGKRHPDEMGEPVISAFLTALSTHRCVIAT